MTDRAAPPRKAPALALEAAKTVEAVVGNGWASDAGGRFTYMTPAVMNRYAVTLADLNGTQADRLIGWRQIVHPADYPHAAAEWRRCLASGDPFEVEHRLLRDCGDYYWTRNSGHPLLDASGAVLGWYGTFIDSDFPASRSQNSGSRSERREIPGAISVGPASADDPTSAAHAEARAFWTGVPQVTRQRRLEADGSSQWTEARAEPGYSVSIDAGEVVSETRPTDETATSILGLTGADPLQCASIIESLFGDGWAFDAQGRWIYLHPFAQSSLGLSLDRLNSPLETGDTAWKMLLHPDDYDRASVAWLQSLATGEDFNAEFRFRRKNGVYAWARTSARAARDGEGQISGWYGIALDIDVYKKTVAALLDREHELSQLVDMVPGHLWRLSSNGSPTYVNRKMRAFFGLDDPAIGKGDDATLAALFRASHPEDEQGFRNGMSKSLANGETFFLRHRLRRKDGVYRWLACRAEPFRDQNGVITNWYGLSFDIDDQMQAEQTLRRSEHELRDLVDSLPVDIMSFDPSGKLITYVSKHHIEQVGPLRAYIKDFDGMAADLTHPDDFPMMYRRSIAGLLKGLPFSHRFRRRNKAGTYRWIEARAQPLRDELGEIVRWYIISIDIEDEVQAREELRIAQQDLARQSQAAGLSELSASIAHEVNQPLAAVVANSHACQRWLAASPPNFERARTTIERIIRDANSAADVVARIRALFKRVPDAHKIWAISEVIPKARELLAEEAQRHDVRIVIDLALGLPLVALDFVQIQQVLVNLIRNGIEAMDCINLESRTLTLRAFHRDDVVQIEVRDNGPGVDDPDRIFEPFHSSKRNGMGMGLAICRSIIESHGGRLRTEPNGRQGAAFIFTLPSRLI